MSIENTNVSVTTPQTSHQEAADALIDDIRALKQRVPNFVVPETKNAARQLAVVASLPPEFVDRAALAVRNNEELTRGGNSGLAETRDLTDYADAYDPVADELEAMAHFIRHSVRVARNQAGSNALTTYALAKRLAKRPETACSRSARRGHAHRPRLPRPRRPNETVDETENPRDIAVPDAAARDAVTRDSAEAVMNRVVQ